MSRVMWQLRYKMSNGLYRTSFYRTAHAADVHATRLRESGREFFLAKIASDEPKKPPKKNKPQEPRYTRSEWKKKFQSVWQRPPTKAEIRQEFSS